MDVKVEHDEEQQRFFADVEGHQAVIEYGLRGDVYDLAHTYVPEELRGKGIAEKLVRGTLEEIRRQGTRFLPSCPYIQSFLKKHPEYAEGLAQG